jgi:hypothetical protein
MRLPDLGIRSYFVDVHPSRKRIPLRSLGEGCCERSGLGRPLWPGRCAGPAKFVRRRQRLCHDEVATSTRHSTHRSERTLITVCQAGGCCEQSEKGPGIHPGLSRRAGLPCSTGRSGRCRARMWRCRGCRPDPPEPGWRPSPGSSPWTTAANRSAGRPGWSPRRRGP